MNIYKNFAGLKKEIARLRKRGKIVGLVPTMGALHEGHLSLVKASLRDNDVTVVSIYVNPLQFGPKEDLKKYPRPVSEDLQLLKHAGVEMVFLPEDKEMYPKDYSTVIDFNLDSSKKNSLTQSLCGKFRPGHFRGVMTVVAKLFIAVTPDRAYFGAKDYQQVKVIEQLNRDLNFGIDIRVMPTYRETDGLAMSSRNRYLNVTERALAGIIPQVLFGIKLRLESGEKDLEKVLADARKKLMSCVDQIQYLEIVDAETLASVSKLKAPLVAAVACYIGKTRLIDNVIIYPNLNGRNQKPVKRKIK